MPEERTSGIIVRTRPLTETSLIVHWITPDLGRIATVAKGARRPNSTFRGKLDLFFVGYFSFVRSRRSDLHTLREVGIRGTNADLRKDLGHVQQASYFVALMEQATETETPVPEIFQLIGEAIAHLPKHPPQPRTVFAFEIKLLAELGLMPDLEEAKLSPGAGQIITRFIDLDWASLDNLKLSSGQIDELGHFLHRFLIFHLGKIPASRPSALAAR
jgi:DNA repair protein RecO (recombination protein O)